MTGWMDRIRRLSTPALMRMAKMGDRIAKMARS